MVRVQARWEAHLYEMLRAPQSPAVSLWAAVLVEGMRDYLRGLRGLPASGVNNAREWVAATTEAVGDFEWICCELDLPADVIRKDLAARIASKFAEARAA